MAGQNGLSGTRGVVPAAMVVLVALLLIVADNARTWPVARAEALSTDVTVTVTGRTSVTTPAFTTAVAGELLAAFVTSDGPRTWRRR